MVFPRGALRAPRGSFSQREQREQREQRDQRKQREQREHPRRPAPAALRENISDG